VASTHVEGMEASRTTHYRTLLLERAQALHTRISAGLRGSLAEEQREPADPGDESDRLHTRDVRNRASQADASRLMEVEDALARVTRGTYGICEDCEEPIDEHRLDLIPEARRCAADQERHEREVRTPDTSPRATL
jgi:DnaK suppressor protein